ncbi:MAG: glycosyltransferase family 1 protein [Planctomycetota bacterium]|nr:MAG: glycosyltransferase family 1 protein [Planctomycetota bacterium]
MKLLIVYYGWTDPDHDTQLPLFRELAARLDFLYVREPIPFRKILQRRGEARLTERSDGLFHIEPVSVLPFGRRPDVLQKNYMRGGLRRALESFPGRRRVVMACRPKMHVLKKMADEKIFIYDCYDDYVFYKKKAAEQELVRSEERKMLAVADAAFCTADTLVEKCRVGAGQTFKVPTGVNFEMFSNPGEEPADIREIPRPRIGTIGKFNRRVDLGLIASAADARPDWSFILVGPVFSQDRSFDRAFKKLVRERSNVYHLGGKPYETLPDYLAAFDAAIVPYALGEVTQGVSPLKIYQFCAQGKPVVATPLPEVEKHSDFVEVAKGADAFIEAIERALEESDAGLVEKRVEYARANTWASRAEQVIEIIRKLLEGVS